MRQPKNIKLNQIAEVIYDKFKDREYINCYIGSNAATPTSSITALTESIKKGEPKLPFIKMLHVLLQGKVPYVEKGLQDRIKAYSIFSGGDVRAAVNDGRAYYLPCTLANIDGLIEKGCRYETDVAIIKVALNKYTGEYSLGLSVEALHTAIDYAKIVIAELDPSMPFTHGQSIVDPSSIDYIIRDEKVIPVYDFLAPDFDNLPVEEQRIGELITKHFITDGATLQVGIGKIPNAVIKTIETSGLKNLGVQTEIYGDGLMRLQRFGIINNRKKQLNKGYSTTSLIAGSRELYHYVHHRQGVQMRPCQYTNSEETIRKNTPFISINTSIGVDLYGNVWADYIDMTRHYSGIGGQPDFIRALNYKRYGTPIIAIKSITEKGDSKIVRRHPPGVNLTASSYDGVVIVTEYGIADLRGLTNGLKAIALASISHPKFRDDLLRQVYDDPMIAKPVGYYLGQKMPFVTMY